MEYYSAIKTNDIMPLAATWMELENLILSEMSQKDQDKYHMISLKRDTCTRMFIAALLTIARTWKQPKCPSTDD